MFFVVLALIVAFAVGYAAGYMVATRKAVIFIRRQQERRARGLWPDPDDPDAPPNPRIR